MKFKNEIVLCVFLLALGIFTFNSIELNCGIGFSTARSPYLKRVFHGQDGVYCTFITYLDAGKEIDFDVEIKDCDDNFLGQICVWGRGFRSIRKSLISEFEKLERDGQLTVEKIQSLFDDLIIKYKKDVNVWIKWWGEVEW